MYGTTIKGQLIKDNSK